MGRRKSSEFLSSFGKAFELLKSVIDAVLAAGGGDVELDLLRNNSDRLKEVGRVVMGEFTSPVKLVARVDYRQRSKSELMEIFFSVDNTREDAIGLVFESGEGYADVSRETRDIEFVLVRCNDYVNTKQAIAEIRRRKLRPALYEELLVFAENFPLETTGPSWHIMALGSNCKDAEGGLLSPFWNTASKVLNALYIEGVDDWDDTTLFLAVRE